MRDYFTHTELILAGMWGGCTGVFPSIATLIRQYTANYTESARFVDQYFLRSILWPTVRHSVLNHDELFEFHGAQPFPAHPPIRWQNVQFHVGSNASYSSISGPSSLPDDANQVISLWQGADGPWEYNAKVKKGDWHLELPFFLINEFTLGQLQVTLNNTQPAQSASTLLREV